MKGEYGKTREMKGEYERLGEGYGRLREIRGKTRQQ